MLVNYVDETIKQIFGRASDSGVKINIQPNCGSKILYFLIEAE